MKKLLFPLLLILLLCACQSDPYAGKYHGVYVEADGGVYRMEDFYNGKSYLELCDGGEAVMYLNEKEHPLTWSLSDGVLTFTEAGDPFYGQLSDGVIRLDYMGWGLILTFAQEGAPVPQTTVPDPEAQALRVAQLRDFWDGDWYGYRCITEASGAYADRVGERKDTAARITLGDDARGHITLWDTEPLGEVVLRVDDTGGEMGIALSGQGTFLDGAVGAGDWLIDPSMYAYENTVEITGYYADAQGDYFYTVYLHPWGQEWEEETLPNGYAWYLQALSQGNPLPDVLMPE